MRDPTLLGPWVRRFLLEHVVGERNLACNTQRSYRDALRLLIPFIAEKRKKPVDHLALVDISAELVRHFLADLETSRHCGAATRNRRLAAIRAFARFVGEYSPAHIEWCGQIRSIPFKKTGRAVVPYFEKVEMRALLAAPDRRTAQGRRDHALLLFLYNSGARASEASELKIRDLDQHNACVKITGKAGKQRLCPLWAGYHRRPRSSDWRTASQGNCFPEPLWSADDPIRYPHFGRASCSNSVHQMSLLGIETRQSALRSAQLCDSSLASGCRYQHDSGMARPCLPGHHQHLRRD